MKTYKRYSAAIRSRKQWKRLRWHAMKRDGFRCVKCNVRGRLEVDHILPVRTHPELSFVLENLQSLCVPCHSRKTRIEVGMGEPNPARDAWRELVHELSHSRKELQNA